MQVTTAVGHQIHYSNINSFDNLLEDICQDLVTRFRCPCHEKSVTYNLPNLSISVKTTLTVADQLIIQTVGKFIFNSDKTIKIQPQPIWGKKSRSVMSYTFYLKHSDQKSNPEISALVRLFTGLQSIYNAAWQEFPNDSHSEEDHNLNFFKLDSLSHVKNDYVNPSVSQEV
jgi:hypothetical protein